MIYRQRYRTAGGFRFSVFNIDNEFDPHNIRIHAPLSPNLDWWDDTIFAEIKDCLISQMSGDEMLNPIQVMIFSPRSFYRFGGNPAYSFFILRSDVISERVAIP